MVIERDFDIVELPLEGVAAYWLSLKKLVGNKKNLKLLEQEASYTSEPFIRYLLELALCPLEDEQVLELARIRQECSLEVLKRNLEIMGLAVTDMAGGGNPRKTLSAMTACFAKPPMADEKVVEMSREVMAAADNPGKKASFFNMHHSFKSERMLVTLYFYLVWVRKEGKMGLAPFLEFVESPYFSEGLSLVMDGFEASFVKRRMERHRHAILLEAAQKMSMSVTMCMGVRGRMGYDELFRIAGAYMVG